MLRPDENIEDTYAYVEALLMEDEMEENTIVSTRRILSEELL